MLEMRSYFNMFNIGFPQYPSPYFSISIIISLRRRLQGVVITSERGTGHHILFSSLSFVSFELFNHISILSLFAFSSFVASVSFGKSLRF